MLVEKMTKVTELEVMYENKQGRFALYVGDRCVAACNDYIAMRAAQRLLGVSGYQSIREKDHEPDWVRHHMDPKERDKLIGA